MNNNKALTPSQALKLYSGNSIVEMTAFFTGFALVFYFSAILIFMLPTGLNNGFANVRQEFYDTMLSNMCLAESGGFITLILSMMTYDKENAGGKFYRSVKGGYETYKKMRLGNMIAAIAVTFLFVGTVCVVNVIFPIMAYGTATCISTLIFLLLSIGIGNLMSLLPKKSIWIGAGLIVFFALGFVGIMSVRITEGKLGWIQIIAGIIAVVLIPVSYKVMINSYRKKRWNN